MKKKRYSILLAAFAISLILPTYIRAEGNAENETESVFEQADSWVKESNTWYYLDSNGKKVTTWQKIDGRWYYFDASGKMQTGWQKVGKYWYYLNPGGSMVTGNKIIRNETNVFSNSGIWQGKWMKNNSGWWFRNSDKSYPMSQWQKLGNHWYHFNGSGYMNTGWTKIGGKWYYLNPGGTMATGWKKVGKSWYYLNPGGTMATGWQKVGKSWYYLNPGGSMATDWKKIDKSWYYLNPGGSMVTGNKKIGNETNVFTNSGIWQGKWMKNRSGWWFRNSDNSYPKYQWKKLGNQWYHFDHSGYINTGWIRVSGKWYYLNSTGSMQTGWKKVNGEWYYLSSNGSRINGWKEIKNKWYYLKANGIMATGRQTIGGAIYEFKSNGVLIGKVDSNEKPNYSDAVEYFLSKSQAEIDARLGQDLYDDIMQEGVETGDFEEYDYMVNLTDKDVKDIFSNLDFDKIRSEFDKIVQSERKKANSKGSLTVTETGKKANQEIADMYGETNGEGGSSTYLPNREHKMQYLADRGITGINFTSKMEYGNNIYNIMSETYLAQQLYNSLSEVGKGYLLWDSTIDNIDKYRLDFSISHDEGNHLYNNLWGSIVMVK